MLAVIKTGEPYKSGYSLNNGIETKKSKLENPNV